MSVEMWLTLAYKGVIQLKIAIVQVTGISYSQDTRDWQADAVAAVRSAAQVLLSQQAGAYASASAVEVGTGSASCQDWCSTVASGTFRCHSRICMACGHLAMVLPFASPALLNVPGYCGLPEDCLETLAG